MLSSELESSNLKAVAWDNDTLFITFKRGNAVYRYENVPLTVYNDLVQAPSPGKFLHTHIIPSYIGTAV